MNNEVVDIPVEDAEVDTAGSESPEPTLVPEATPSEAEVKPEVCSGCAAAGEATQQYVYAMGNVDIRFPNQGMEHEFDNVINRMVKAGKLKRLDEQTQEPKTNGQLLYELLTLKEENGANGTNATMNPAYLYLAKDVCWVLIVAGVDAYQLTAQCISDFQNLIMSLHMPPPSATVPKPMTHLEVVVGEVMNASPQAQCATLGLPNLLIHHYLCMEVKQFVEALLKQWPAGDAACQAQDPHGAEVVQNQLMRLCYYPDNMGSSPEHRALNYLTINYPYLYEVTCKRLGEHDGYPQVHVLRSPTHTDRQVMDVLLTYVNATTNVPTRFVARVDVTDMFPFLVSPLQGFYG